MAKKEVSSNIEAEVRKIISDITEVPEEELKPQARFVEDLGLDSMMALELVAAIEKRYKVAIPEEKIPELTCLQKIYDILNNK